MATQPKMTLEDHAELGQQIKDFRSVLFNVLEALPKSWPAARKINQADKILCELKMHMEGLIHKDFPDEPFEKTKNIYYGK